MLLAVEDVVEEDCCCCCCFSKNAIAVDEEAVLFDGSEMDALLVSVTDDINVGVM